MPFDGSGTYTPAAAPNFPAVGGAVISSTYYNAVVNDLCTNGLSNVLTRDGQGQPSAAIGWNSQHLTGVNNFGAVTATFTGLVTASSLTVSTSATVTTTLGVSGAVSFGTTLAVVGAATVGGTLGVTGVTTLGTANITTASLTNPLGIASGGTAVATVPTNGQLLIGNGTGYTVASLTAGSGISITPGAGSITIANTGAGGTVTSVAVSGGATGLTTSGGPVTGAGTITLAGTLIGANGGTGLTTFTAANNAIYSTSSSALTAGTLPVLAGGTGATTASGARTALGLGSIATFPEVTTAEYRANTADRALSTDQVWAAAAFVALTDAATIAIDLSTFINAKVTLGGNRNLGVPSNGKEGQSGIIMVTQDGTGNRTLGAPSGYVFTGSVAPTASTAAGAVDMYNYVVLPSGAVWLSQGKGVA